MVFCKIKEDRERKTFSVLINRCISAQLKAAFRSTSLFGAVPYIRALCKLGIVECGVEAAQTDKLLVVALLGNRSVLDYKDGIRVLNR